MIIPVGNSQSGPVMGCGQGKCGNHLIGSPGKILHPGPRYQSTATVGDDHERLVCGWKRICLPPSCFIQSFIELIRAVWSICCRIRRPFIKPDGIACIMFEPPYLKPAHHWGARPRCPIYKFIPPAVIPVFITTSSVNKYEGNQIGTSLRDFLQGGVKGRVWIWFINKGRSWICIGQNS